MISSVSMTHFKNHTAIAIEFMAGINALIGPGGCGKTSVMEAIGWAMFGTLQGKKSSFEQIGHEDVGQVELQFDEYAVFKSFAGHSELHKDHIDHRQEDSEVGPYAIERRQLLVAGGEMDVRETIADILGSKRLETLFPGLIGVTQGSIDSFFSRSTSERVKHFSKIIGVDEYKRCADWLIDAWHAIEAERLALVSRVASMEDDEETYLRIGKELDGYQAELLELKEYLIPEREMRLRGKMDAIEGLRSTLAGIDRMAEKIEDIDTRLNMPEIDKAMRSIAGHFCPECGTMVKGHRMESIKKKYQDMFDEGMEFSEEKARLQSEIEIEKRHIVMAGSDMDELGRNLEAENTHLHTLIEKRGILEGSIDAMKSVAPGGLAEKLASGREKLKKTEVAKKKLETIRAVCRKVPTIVSEATTAEVSGLATYFVRMIYEDWSINWDSDFSIMVTMGDMELPFTSLSKSQKAIASLSVLLGLAKVVSPVDFILLDEPFSNMDANQVALVATAIRTTGWFNQVILTTHRSEVEHIFDNVIEVNV